MEEFDVQEIFRHRVPVQIRFNDVDQNGHVNNNAYFAFYDLGKEEYLREVLHLDLRQSPVVPIIANINADFIVPIFYGDKILIETRVSRLGTKSFTLRQRTVKAETGEVACNSSTVMVCFSLVERHSVEIPPTIRRAIEDFEGASLARL